MYVPTVPTESNVTANSQFRCTAQIESSDIKTRECPECARASTYTNRC